MRKHIEFNWLNVPFYLQNATEFDLSGKRRFCVFYLFSFFFIYRKRKMTVSVGLEAQIEDFIQRLKRR